MALKKNSTIYNILFLIICGGILLVLWDAPEETTARIPFDDTHKKFYTMSKKTADKLCISCHNDDNMVLPDGHPPKYRCLFCHKKVEQ